MGWQETVTKRASPIKHDVGGHFRGGKFIESFERGSGERKDKKKNRRNRKNDSPKTVKGRNGLAYHVTLSGQGNAERYKGFGSPVASLRQAIGKLQRPIVPTRVVLRRIED